QAYTSQLVNKCCKFAFHPLHVFSLHSIADMGISRDKVILILGTACLCMSICLSEYPQEKETLSSVGLSSGENPSSRGTFFSWLFNPNAGKRYDDPLIHIFGEGGDNEHIDLLLPTQRQDGEKVSSLFAPEPPLNPYSPSQSPSPTFPSLAPTIPPIPVPISPPFVAPTPSPGAQSPSSLPSPAPISISPSPSPSPSPPTSSPAPASYPSVTPASTPSPIKPPSPTPSPTLSPSPIFPPSVSPAIFPPSPSVSPPSFSPSPSVSPPTFPPSSSPSPSVSPPTFPPSSSPSPSVSPPTFPPSSAPSPSAGPPVFPPHPPSQSPSPSPFPAPTSPSPSPTPSGTPSSQPLPSPSPTPTPPTPSPTPIPPKISILTNLTVSNGAKLVPDFNPFVFNYTVSFGSKVRRFHVTAFLPEDQEGYKYSSLYIESIPLKSGKESPPLKLGKRGETVTFHIDVRAINHDPSTYVLSATREHHHKGLGTVAIVFVVLACILGAMILLVLGYAAYVYARTGRTPQLRDFQFFGERESSIYTPLIASGVTNDASRR
ncbi:hypothetical protein KI387_017669, partial [Taxus chinensis]